jgi:hypothetical protein
MKNMKKPKVLFQRWTVQEAIAIAAIVMIHPDRQAIHSVDLPR